MAFFVARRARLSASPNGDPERVARRGELLVVEPVMKTIWNEAARRELETRFGAIKPEAKPAWGRMSAPQMVTHVADSL